MYYLCTFLLALFGSIFYLKWARKENILDIPNYRSSHTTPTIRGGGIIFILVISSFFIHNSNQIWQLVIGFYIVAILGLIDDKQNLDTKLKIPFQLIGLTFIFYPFIQELTTLINFPIWIIIPFGLLFINFYNFIDGINGMLGIYTIVTSVSLLILNYVYPMLPNDLFISILIGSLVFGFYNFRSKAILFSGDVGSLSLGLIFFYCLIVSCFTLNSILPVFFFYILLLDTSGTLIKRIINNRNILRAHREHLYERLANENKIQHLKVSICYGGLQLMINLLVIYLIAINKNLTVLYGIVIILVSIGVYFYLDKKIKPVKT